MGDILFDIIPSPEARGRAPQPPPPRAPNDMVLHTDHHLYVYTSYPKTSLPLKPAGVGLKNRFLILTTVAPGCAPSLSTTPSTAASEGQTTEARNMS
jgi:hypothetical protein